MLETETALSRVTVCAYEGQTEAVLYFWVCNQCPNFLEVCNPCVGSDGYLHGNECGDLYLCEDCTDANCIYYQPRYEERKMLE